MTEKSRLKPNILILHTDQQRFDSLGCVGGIGAKTPNIDSLAKDGLLFERHMSSNPICSPSRASLLTGMTVPGHELICNGMSLWRPSAGKISEDNKRRHMRIEGIQMREKVPTLADICKEEGYETAAFGKLHLQSHLAEAVHDPVEAYTFWQNNPDLSNWQGPYYGFDFVRMVSAHGEATCFPGGGAHYSEWLKKEHLDVLENVMRKEHKGASLTNKSIYMSEMTPEIHNTSWIANEFIKHLDCRQESPQPFMAFLGFPDPHHPWTPPRKIAEMFADAPLPDFSLDTGCISNKPATVLREYASKKQRSDDISLAYRYTLASIYMIDIAIGKVIEYLKCKDLYDNTIIIFTSDHGDYLGDFSCLTKSFCTCRQLIHVPLIIKPVSGHNIATVNPHIFKETVSNYDVMPTVLNMAGIGIPTLIQGRDVFSDCGGIGIEASFAASYAHRYEMNNFSLTDNRFRYTYYPVSGEEELYDHKSDFKEENNIVATTEYAGIRKELKSRLAEMHLLYDLHAWGRYGLW